MTQASYSEEEAFAAAPEEKAFVSPPEPEAAAEPDLLSYTPAVEAAAPAEEPSAEETDADQMSELYEESLRRVQEGEVVQGRIVSLTKDFVMVDIGYKSEGQIPIAEFTTPDGEVTAQVGDPVEALLQSREDEEGPLMLSKNKASRMKVWEEVSYAYHNEGAVEGLIVAKVKGGFSVDLGGVIAFLPGSQVDLLPIRTPDSLLNQRFTFNVLKFTASAATWSSPAAPCWRRPRPPNEPGGEDRYGQGQSADSHGLLLMGREGLQQPKPVGSAKKIPSPRGLGSVEEERKMQGGPGEESPYPAPFFRNSLGWGPPYVTPFSQAPSGRSIAGSGGQAGEKSPRLG